jgi:hypothetical protein
MYGLAIASDATADSPPNGIVRLRRAASIHALAVLAARIYSRCHAAGTASRVSSALRHHFVAAALMAAIALQTHAAAAQTCVGDCNGDGEVSIDELILAVNIALGAAPLSECPNLDDGQGMVGVDRLITAVNGALCNCQDCGAPTPTPTGEATPTSTPAVSTWHVDNYEIGDSDCNGLIERAVLNGFESDYTVTEFSDGRVEIDDGHGGVFDGTADADGTVHVTTTLRDSIVTCDYRVDVDASANLSQSPTTATYDASVNLSGFCVGLSDCSMRITSRWTRRDDAGFGS